MVYFYKTVARKKKINNVLGSDTLRRILANTVTCKRVRQLDLTNNKQLCKFFVASISVHIASCRHKECTDLVGGIKIEDQHEYCNYSILDNITSPTDNVSCD